LIDLTDVAKLSSQVAQAFRGPSISFYCETGVDSRHPWIAGFTLPRVPFRDALLFTSYLHDRTGYARHLFGEAVRPP
jgi:hypothetical protein